VRHVVIYKDYTEMQGQQNIKVHRSSYTESWLWLEKSAETCCL